MYICPSFLLSGGFEGDYTGGEAP
ncbi:MAG: hypothetical protein RL757_729, partial [Bacteroidota bacterium]